MYNALAGNLSPSLTTCNTRPRWHCTRSLTSAYLLLAFCLQALVWELVCWWPFGCWPPITILDDPSPDLSAAWSVGGYLVTDPRSPLLAIASLVSLSPDPRVTLRVVHVVLCCWRHRLPMTDRIIRRRLGEGIAQLRRRPTRASPRSNFTKARQSQYGSPIPMGRKDHGGSNAVWRPQNPITRGSNREKRRWLQGHSNSASVEQPDSWSAPAALETPLG